MARNVRPNPPCPNIDAHMFPAGVVYHCTAGKTGNSRGWGGDGGDEDIDA